MKNDNNVAIQVLCVWSGLAYALILWVAMIPLANFFPPPSPNMSVTETALLFKDHADGIRANGVLWMIAAGFYVPFICVIFIQMKRIEGRFPVLSYVQLIGGVMTMVVTALGGVIWCVLTYREYANPEIVMVLNDMSWFILFFNISPAVFQNLSIGIIGLRDTRKHPMLPKWLCWFNIWLAFAFLPDIMIPYFKRGPFAWDGFIAFTLPMGLFFVWFIVMIRPLIAVIRRTDEEADAV